MELAYKWADLYPNMGSQTTSLDTVAEPEDQNAMVDDQALAVKHQVKEDPATLSKIWLAVGAIVAILIFLGVVKS